MNITMLGTTPGTTCMVAISHTHTCATCDLGKASDSQSAHAVVGYSSLTNGGYHRLAVGVHSKHVTSDCSCHTHTQLVSPSNACCGRRRLLRAPALRAQLPFRKGVST